MDNSVIKLAIIEDKREMLEFLREMFETRDGYVCKHCYQNAEWALKFLPDADIDLAIVDIGLPGISGIDCVKKLKKLRPEVEFMMHTVFGEDQKIFDSLKAGASGYLIKDNKEETVISAVRELIEGGSPMSPSIARRVTTYFFDRPRARSNKTVQSLSKRETELLELLAKGFLYKEIAEKMHITTGTVKQHIHRIYKKLHVQNRTEAINKFWGFFNY